MMRMTRGRHDPFASAILPTMLLWFLALTNHPCLGFAPVQTYGKVMESRRALLPTTMATTTTTTTGRSAIMVDMTMMMDTASLSSSSSLLVVTAESSWRQYVPLVVSLLVITDILLGSPAANTALSILRPKETENGDEPIGGGGGNRFKENLKERVDSMAVAQQALDKAAATTELRKFLDESKSDMDKMRDVQKKLDDQLAQYDKKKAEKDQKE